ncbi:hypothetical protein FRB94_008297 [Tulasnella sp. JGI-2019a]|nr:hypothetical protein FRB93_006991 [Tulasnella sp. JGI-2019a]KAG9011466.1 hypothetical protein FRB94_008297 [Tulasnella sp. JGI-2019a]KAG9033678.1 hypothetical protein FRB95_014467 [Tulasnella sp. JGI-2019a]
MSSDGVEAFWLGHSGAYAITSTSRVMVKLCNNEDRESFSKYMTMGQVETLVISPYNSSQYFIAMADGRMAWSTPEAWHEAIKTTVTSAIGQSTEASAMRLKLQSEMARRQMEFMEQQVKMVADKITQEANDLSSLTM